MKLFNRLTKVQTAVVSAVLLCVLIFLYAKTQSLGGPRNVENFVLLRQVKQLDAQSELDVLRTKLGINPSYDPLTRSQTELSALLEKLDVDIRGQKHLETATLSESRTAVLRAFEEKATLIEQFKSNNSVLHNSQVFLPTAAQDIKQAIGRTGSNSQPAFNRTLTIVDKVLIASVLNSQSASGERNAEIEDGLSRLESSLHGFPRPVIEKLEIFVAHARVMLREQKNVLGLLNAIATVPTTQRMVHINSVLSREREKAEALGQQYRGYLLIFSAIVVALLASAVVHVIRTQAVLNRTNKELLGANDNLENRVQARTQQLRLAQGELVTSARQAGMAEIANNVLHNVGNVLNSVNVATGLVAAKLRASSVQGLARAVGLMDERAGDLGEFLSRDPKGKLLPAYLRELAKVLEAEHAAMADELGALGKNVDHIKEIVATQQSYAGTQRLIQSTKIGELVDDALRINNEVLMLDHVEVVKNVAEVCALPLDRNRVLQILVNLIRNAGQAMRGMADRHPCITLGAVLINAGVLRITVADNGPGIAAENLTRVFAHGFTTRKGGHGFGLHSCAMAAHEMGGSMSAHSDGPGKGATFTLDIAIDAPKDKP